jgi:folate-binding protein YgfZ
MKPNYTLLSHGILKISGDDAATFLQGQLTCDIRELNDQRHGLGAYCNLQGRVLATFRIFQADNHYYLIMPADLVDTTLETLKKYIFRSKVSLENKTADFACFGLAGDESQVFLQTYFKEIPRTTNQAVHINNVSLLNVDSVQPRFYLIAEKKIAKEIMETLPAQKILMTEEDWRRLEILAGIPTIYPETSGKFTPHMLNYPALNGVSLTKGCYLGQEIIARTEYLGKAKRQLQQIKIMTEEMPTRGEKIVNAQQQELGVLIDACPDESETKTQAYLALVVL